MATAKRVQKWGNSLAFRIPKTMADELGIHEGSEVELRIESGRIVAVPKQVTLDELVDGITEENRHDEISPDVSRGAEAW